MKPTKESVLEKLVDLEDSLGGVEMDVSLIDAINPTTVNYVSLHLTEAALQLEYAMLALENR